MSAAFMVHTHDSQLELEQEIIQQTSLQLAEGPLIGKHQ